MKGLMSFILLVSLAMSNSAMAIDMSELRWIKLKHEKGMTYYLEKNNFEKSKPGFVTTWERIDFDKPTTVDNMTFRSSMITMEYDCTNRKKTSRYIATYSDRGLKGKITAAGYSEENWIDVRPQMLDEEIMELACSKQ